MSFSPGFIVTWHEKIKFSFISCPDQTTNLSPCPSFTTISLSTLLRAPLALHGGISMEDEKKGKGKLQYHKTQDEKPLVASFKHLSLDAAVDAVINAMENIAVGPNEDFEAQYDSDASGSEPEFVGYSPRKMAGKPCTSQEPARTRQSGPASMELRDPPPYQPRSQPPPLTPSFRNEVRPPAEDSIALPGASNHRNQLPGVRVTHPSSSVVEPFAQSSRRQNYTMPLMAPTSHSQQSPRKSRQPFSAYVVYRSTSPSGSGVYYDWPTTQSVVDGDRNAVYKGFPTRLLAETCYNLSYQSGIIDLLRHDLGTNTEPFYAVVEGTAPGVYPGRYRMLRDGLNWSHGVVYAFRDVEPANSYFVRQFMAGRVVTLNPVVVS
ncbi:hypothetical protein K435DRAFT_874586 [Dendrothele bispora CBS 962.96]|uniref:Ribonuclease H1 N-terminal domain-containing protein n=1 Tax=Dendrothele bispora (strain CBS 962.96) TaxID=1314807 RepID=A0A4V4HBQ6_DENBC|nr:hypothetical protein K435DRAFT_874586 [Dendrothele bispora CBS 962.96]